MNKPRVIVVLVAVGFVAVLSFGIRPNLISQMASMAAVFVLLVLTMVAAVFALLRSSREGMASLFPVGICVMGLFLNFLVAPYLGRAIRLWVFHRQLPRYMEVVQRVEKGECKVRTSLTKIELTGEYANLAWTALGKTNSFGEATVEFIIGGGFPVKHSGYLYMSCGKIESDTDTLRRWPRHKKIEDRWYVIGD